MWMLLWCNCCVTTPSIMHCCRLHCLLKVVLTISMFGVDCWCNPFLVQIIVQIASFSPTFVFWAHDTEVLLLLGAGLENFHLNHNFCWLLQEIESEITWPLVPVHELYLSFSFSKWILHSSINVQQLCFVWQYLVCRTELKFDSLISISIIIDSCLINLHCVRCMYYWYLKHTHH